MATETNLGKVHLFPSVSSYKSNISKVTKSDICLIQTDMFEMLKGAVKPKMTKILSGPLGNGNITLSQSYRNFDSILVIHGPDDTNYISDFKIIPVWLLDYLATTGKYIAIGAGDGRWYIQSGFTTTQWNVASENSVIHSIWGLKYE